MHFYSFSHIDMSTVFTAFKETPPFWSWGPVSSISGLDGVTPPILQNLDRNISGPLAASEYFLGDDTKFIVECGFRQLGQEHWC